MASAPAGEGIGDDFLDQLFCMPGYGGGGEGMVPSSADIAVQLHSGEGPSTAVGGGYGGAAAPFPLKLGLDQGAAFVDAAAEAVESGKRLRDNSDGKAPAKLERDPVQLTSLIPAFGHMQPHQSRPNPPRQVFLGQVTQSAVATTPQPPAPRPRVRARRGQATDPHSIAERLRREKIAERMRALQELLPNSNKTDRAVMLDEILDYVKFLKLQVKRQQVLSMSRLGGTGAVAQLVADVPLSSAEGDKSEGGNKQQQVWEEWSTDGTERQVAKLMEQDIGQAMQFLQSKALCIMPISLATAIYSHHQSEPPSTIKPEPNTPS